MIIIFIRYKNRKKILPKGVINPRQVKVKIVKTPPNLNQSAYVNQLGDNYSPKSLVKINRRKLELDELKKKGIRRFNSELIQTNKKKDIMRSNTSEFKSDKVVPIEDNDFGVIKQCSEYLIEEIERETKNFDNNNSVSNEINNFDSFLNDSKIERTTLNIEEIEKETIEDLLKESEELIKNFNNN